ncbi:MAG: hypothetical protein HRU15_17775, partial [Planctomycetes bacterium]|nr:hypothetical protein [Planctomycetota bacterium]
PTDGTEYKDAQAAWKKINTAASLDKTDLESKKIDNKKMLSFIRKWPHTDAALSMSTSLNPFLETELKEITDDKRMQKKIVAFIKIWKGMPAADKAQQYYDQQAQLALDAILAQESLKDRIKGLGKFAKSWPYSTPAKNIMKTFNQLAKSELDRIQAITDTKLQKTALKSWVSYFSKSKYIQAAQDFAQTID